MPWSFIVPAAATLFGASQQSNAARDAANAANAQSEKALALQTRMYDEGIARQQPFYQAGVNALPDYLKGIAPGGEYVRNFTMNDFNKDPGYAFRLSEGQKALDRQAAARGGLISGAALRGATRYGQEMGTQDYGRALQDFYGRQDVARNANAGVVGFAPTASNAMTNLGTNYGNATSSNLMDQGTNTGNAMLQAAQARTSAYQGIGSLYGRTQPNFNSMFSNGSSGPVSMPGYGGVYDTQTYMGR